MMGYPGAGKTTAANIIHDLTGAVHLSSDALRLEMFPEPRFSEAEHRALYKELNVQTEQLLKQGVSVIYDANLNRYEHRKEKYDICRRTGAQPLLLWVQTPKATAKDRAAHDSRIQLAPKNESLNDMFERIAGLIEPPRNSEPRTVIDGTKIAPEYIAQTLNIA